MLLVVKSWEDRRRLVSDFAHRLVTIVYLHTAIVEVRVSHYQYPFAFTPLPQIESRPPLMHEAHEGPVSLPLSLNAPGHLMHIFMLRGCLPEACDIFGL